MNNPVVKMATPFGFISWGFGSLQVFMDENMADIEIVQHRFPRSKRKRIRKKWAKKPKNNKRIVKPWAHFISDEKTFIAGHPWLIKKLGEEIQKRNERKRRGNGSHRS